MGRNSQHLVYLATLIEQARQGTISEEKLLELDHILKKDERSRAAFLEFSYMDSALNKFFENRTELSHVSFKDVSDETKMLDEALRELADDQLSAPAIDISESKPSRELIQKVVYQPREKRKLSNFSKIFLVMNSAVLLLLFLFLRFAPSKYGVDVATLTDTINARWADVTGSMEKGTRLTTRSDKWFLREGLAELVFDNRTKVVIEGPAEFGLLAEDRIDLQYGRIYATVPRQAIGFTVSTPTSRIIDLGTEFGVQADAFGDVSLHVIQGKTTLLTGGKSSKVNLEVREGQAKKVSGETLDVSDIPCQTGLFVRDIDSVNHLAWKGQTSLSLADMAGGGNGFSTGRLNVWLDLATGREGTNLILNPGLQITGEEIARIEKRFTDNRFHPVTHLPYVDGVFSPDGGAGAVRISTTGNVWPDCPDTSGIYFEDIFNGSYIESSYRHKLILQGQTYGTKENPALALHSNSGITFDLDAIRADIPGLEITRFKSLCGVSQEAGTSSQRTDFYVLVDGKNRFQSLGMRSDSAPGEISIPLDKADRFLTLVTTDGDMWSNNDWGFFALPRLEIENAK